MAATRRKSRSSRLSYAALEKLETTRQPSSPRASTASSQCSRSYAPLGPRSPSCAQTRIAPKRRRTSKELQRPRRHPDVNLSTHAVAPRCLVSCRGLYGSSSIRPPKTHPLHARSTKPTIFASLPTISNTPAPFENPNHQRPSPVNVAPYRPASRSGSLTISVMQPLLLLAKILSGPSPNHWAT